MVKIFGVDIAKVVAGAMGAGLLPATLTRVEPGTRTTGAGGTNPTTTTHSARGIVSDYADGQIDGTLIQIGDRKILLLAGTISGGAVPLDGDRVTIQGRTYSVVRVTSDPANATYVCQGRGP